MTGGLLQLVAVGAQDVYLTSNPQITFWKSVYRRHTNFAIDTVDVTFMNNPRFGDKVSVNIPRQGDLLCEVYLRVVLSGATASGDAKWAWVRRIGHELVKSAELYIGGQKIDKHTSHWYNMWYDLTSTQEKDAGYLRMIGDTPALTTLNSSHDSTVLYIPLKFFHCREYGSALPLISLQYHEVKIEIELESLEKLLITSGFSTNTPGNQLGLYIEDARLVCEMALLDTDERRRFAQQSAEMLIEQVQWNGSEALNQLNNRITLNFNHPVKEMIWTVRLGKYLNPSGSYKYLAYNPLDIDLARLEATKRFVLACARYSGANTLVLSGNLVLPAINLPASLLTKFNAFNAAAVSTSPTVGNITILGELISLEDFSTPIATLLDGVTRPIEGDGQAIYDVTVRLPGNYGIYMDKTVNPMAEATLQFNGIDRISRDAEYYNYVQPHKHHTRSAPDGLNVYSFALRPEEFQPSGTCNFSRVDTAVLSLIIGNSKLNSAQLYSLLSTDSIIDVYGLSYNILRIMSGMAGLSYSN